MTCQEVNQLIDAYMDGELTGDAAATITDHLGTCAACQRQLDQRQALGRLIRTLPYYEAPDRLRTSVSGRGRSDQIRRRVMQWTAAAAAILVAATTVTGVRGWQVARRTSAVADAVVARHVDSMAATPLFEVASSDQHTVKPWFQDKLDFSPPVPDLSSSGFALEGGRLDRIDGHPAAALVYRRRLHIIHVFIWSERDGARVTDSRTIRGFHERHWTRGGLSMWVVSDVNDEDLNTFVRRFDATGV